MRHRWRALLGQNVVELDDLDAVCETIALLVGLGEAAQAVTARPDGTFSVADPAARDAILKLREDPQLAATMAGIVEENELAGGPAVRQVPGGVWRAANIEATVDQHTGDTVQRGGVLEYALLTKEGPVPPVVRD